MSTQSDRPLDGIHALVVDDDDALRAVMCRFLEHAGCTVIDAAAPNEAAELARAHRGRLDVALVDLVLPEMSGPECADMLLSDCPGLSIVYISGYAEAVSGGEPGDPEMPALIPKPFARNELIDVIRRAVRPG